APPFGSVHRSTSSAAERAPVSSTRSSASIQPPGARGRSAGCRRRALTRRRLRSGRRRTWSAGTPAAAGSTRSSPGGPARPCPPPVGEGRGAGAGGGLATGGAPPPTGPASAAVLDYVPGTHRVAHVGRLPAVTTHAAAAALGDVVYVVGGRGAAIDSPTRRVV